MTSTADIITFLRAFNLWRRGDDSITQPQPGMAGKMIDAACDHIERLEQELHKARDWVFRLRKHRAIARNFGEQMERERDEARIQYRSTLALAEALANTQIELKKERDHWKSESLEQAKLLAMSADREEKLRAKEASK